ncbi:MAG TPA: endonuclease/exonuclease/phosphatase family protein, partial [Pirellulales bacterium]|nr:endonuclease/exonuclease/phosphatase family protein [Pirellulales bacterium]
MKRPSISRLLAGCTWLYAASVLALWGVLRCGGDRWWWATVLLFGPQWIYAAPLAVLFPAAVVWRRRALLVLAAAATVVVLLVMGFCVPSPQRGADGGASLRVLSCNLDGPKCKVELLEALVREIVPDVMAFQECPDDVVEVLIAQGGWYVERSGRLCVASRYRLAVGPALIDDGQLGYWGAWAAKYTASAPDGDMDFVVVHLETPREGFESLMRHGVGGRHDVQNELVRRARISELARALAGDGPTLIVAGDFNMPCDSAIYRRHWAGLSNAFSEAGFGFGSTKRTRWFGIRIDHVLAGPGWHVERAWVGAYIGSSHRPLIVQLARR